MSISQGSGACAAPLRKGPHPRQSDVLTFETHDNGGMNLELIG